MTNTPTHYFNFKPCDEVVQYDGDNWHTVATVMWQLPQIPTPFNERMKLMVETEISVGQWLIRQDGKVWVQDEEPPRVERWE